MSGTKSLRKSARRSRYECPYPQAAEVFRQLAGRDVIINYLLQYEKLRKGVFLPMFGLEFKVIFHSTTIGFSAIIK